MSSACRNRSTPSGMSMHCGQVSSEAIATVGFGAVGAGALAGRSISAYARQRNNSKNIVMKNPPLSSRICASLDLIYSGVTIALF